MNVMDLNHPETTTHPHLFPAAVVVKTRLPV